jgi:uncharacterized protein involved in exopolysaccharide biosynthesis
LTRIRIKNRDRNWIVIDLKFYFSLFLRRLHYFLIVLTLGTVVGLTLAWMLPPVYMAEAVLVVESEQIPDELAASTVQIAATEQLQIIQQRILTRDTLLEMANRLKIYAPASGQPVRRLEPDEIVEDLRQRITIRTTGGTQARGPIQATIIRVGFEAPTAQLAAAVTNEVVTLILRENVSMRTTVAGQTLEYFVQEVARLDRELASRSAAILTFKEANSEALPDSLEFRRSQQAAAQERLLLIERDEAILKDRRQGLVTLYETTGRVATPSADSQTAEARQLQALRDQLGQTLAVLAPQNPKVKLLESQITALEKIVADQAAAATPLAPAGEVLSPLDIQLADIDRQLAFLADLKMQVTAELDVLQVSIEATPSNALALDTLERDYANTRAQYDAAVANKARAETGDTIEALSKGQRISIIEQAIAPREPTRPNRPLIAAGGVGVGLFAGLGLVVLIELLKGAVRRPADITARLGIAPFATLPYLRTAGQTSRRRTIIGLSFVLVLLAIPAGLWLVHTQVTPLDLLLDRMVQKIGLSGQFLPSSTI